ncbi:unnamed protein product [Diatraea saccharalis]|uniref:Golgin-84 n=1 Tax=Diatraea saccharalis TaxID=40085 RepID=A0A9P0C9Z7_9NEOP|nr:unnamed protein product [Diatraea saccharalis]
MSWFADLAGRAENLLTNLDEQTGAALRNHNVVKSKKHEKQDYSLIPEPPWAQKKRPTTRNIKKVSTATETKSNNLVPTRKLSPLSNVSRQSRSPAKDSVEYISRPSRKKSPVRKNITQYSIEHCPNTLVGDLRDSEVEDQFCLKERRYSLPADLELISNHETTYKIQNLEIENAMLKNELNVMNREVSELLDRLRKTEDELSNKQTKLDCADLQNKKLNLDLESQNSQLVQLKHKIYEINNNEVLKQKERSDMLEMEIGILRDRNEELEEKLKQLTEQISEKSSFQIKLENDLRHAQSTIVDLQANLEKSNEECRRLEKDWEAYKLRVKGMLFAKDNEIKALQDGVTVAEDTKTLTDQLEQLKEERDFLSEAISRVKNECDDMKQQIEQMESRHATAERVVTALREALRDERAANNKTEAQYLELGKEMKTLQIETGQTIASLRSALREKENELSQLRNSTSSVRVSDTSALNVADYDVTQQSVDEDRVHYLTEALVQKQNKIDTLLADNNMLKIQLEKLEVIVLHI